MVIDFLLNMLLAMILIGLFRVMRHLLKIRKVLKKYKDNPNVESITIVNGEVKVVEKQETKKVPVMEMVTDEICHQVIEKEKAYRVVKDGIEHFFCSWDCREKFLAQTSKGNE